MLSRAKNSGHATAVKHWNWKFSIAKKRPSQLYLYPQCDPFHAVFLWSGQFFGSETDLISLLILFLFFVLISFFFLFLLGLPSSRKPNAPSFQIGSGWNWQIVVQVDTHRSTDSDFQFHVTLSACMASWPPYTQKSTATLWVHTQRLPRAYAAASASSWSVVHSY